MIFDLYPEIQKPFASISLLLLPRLDHLGEAPAFVDVSVKIIGIVAQMSGNCSVYTIQK